MLKKTLLTAACMLLAWGASLGSTRTDNAGISPELLEKLRSSYQETGANKAIRNAMAANDINKLAMNADRLNTLPTTEFTYRVPTKGITDQKSSGRCWLFTGLNVLRSQMMAQHDLPKLTLSQNYNFFYDQLEKCNLFLQSIIDTKEKPMEDATVQWLFKNPLSDGGQYTGLSDNIMKYGVVPTEVMAETFSSNNTRQLNRLLGLKLREWGLELRGMNKTANAMQRKEEMLKEVYRILALTLGVPPTEFTWTRHDSTGKALDTRKYTPQEFYNTYCGNDLYGDYVMLMNDPSRQYYKLYEIDLDRHSYDGGNWIYLNLPVEDIKKMAIESLKDSAMMYFSCDVGKFIDREHGVLDVNNYDYESLLGTTFGMNKADRIRTYASASSHAMTLVAVALDTNGTPTKWMVENSWGPGANDGHLIISDKWMDEYMFRLVVNKKYVPEKLKPLFDTKPEILPAWDPMFAPEM